MQRPLVNSLSVSSIVVLAGVTLVSLGLHQYVGYDSIWHVFIADQETWPQLLQEINVNAHPPVFYLALRYTLRLFGNSYLSYRLVSIVSVLVAIPLMALVTRRVTSNQSLSVAAAAAFGLSFSLADVGLEIRAYALSILFLLLSLAAYLKWLLHHPKRLDFRVRLGFAVFLSLALLTHYASFFFLAACWGAPVILMLLHRRWRLRFKAELGTLPASLAMFGFPAITGLTAFWFHAKHWGGTRLNHLPEFMFDPAREGPLQFLSRTSQHLVSLFVPGPAAVVALAAALGLAGAVWLTVRQRHTVRLLPLALLFIMVVLNAVAGLTHRYPFGGVLRHEMFLFPFVVLFAASLADSVRRALPGALRGRLAWSIVGIVVVGVNFIAWRSAFVIGPPFMDSQRVAFRKAFAPRGAVLTDQFNFIVLFAHHADWKWHVAWQELGSSSISQVWEVSRGDERFKVCRSGQWLFDEAAESSYVDVSECLERTAEPEVVVFRPEQPETVPTGRGPEAIGLARKFAEELDLQVTREAIEGNDFYVAFSAVPPADPSEKIEILEASYGANCSDAARHNATKQVGLACDQKGRCRYKVSVEAIGDPKPGCAKDFHVEWRCSPERPSLALDVPAEAGFGAATVISCRRP